jgi:hypothetical protein
MAKLKANRKKRNILNSERKQSGNPTVKQKKPKGWVSKHSLPIK